MQYKCIPCEKDEVSLFLTALENSWIHLRRKKRERVRQLRELPRASVDFLQAPEEKEKDSSKTTEREGNEAGSTQMESLELESPESDSRNNSSPVKEGNSESCTEESGQTEEPDVSLAGSEESSSTKESKDLATASQAAETGHRANVSNEWFLFKCVLNVKPEGEDFLVEMHWVEGQNRDLMNQLCTYLKNQIFRLVGT